MYIGTWIRWSRPFGLHVNLTALPHPGPPPLGEGVKANLPNEPQHPGDPMTNDTNPQALITGASSGLGEAFAERLAADHYDLVLVARRLDRLEALAQRLSAAHGVAAEALAADLGTAEGIRAVEARIGALPRLERLVNNAGFGAYMPFVELPPERLEELIRVQVTAVARLARAALPGMIARGQGAVINVASRLGFSAPLTSPPLPKRAAYAASKSFSITFSQILADELKGTGVQAQALCPGVVATEFHERVGLAPGSFPADLMMSAADTVQAALAGLALGE